MGLNQIHSEGKSVVSGESQLNSCTFFCTDLNSV